MDRSEPFNLRVETDPLSGNGSSVPAILPVHTHDDRSTETNQYLPIFFALKRLKTDSASSVVIVSMPFGSWVQ
jgi:hypothetical protein